MSDVDACEQSHLIVLFGGIPIYSNAGEVLLLELMGGVATCDSATCFLGVSVYSNAGEVLL